MLRAMLQGRANESHKQRVGLGGSALEFRVTLACQEPRMTGNFHHFRQAPIGRKTRDAQPGTRQRVAVGVVHLVAMAMAFVDNLFAVHLMGKEPLAYGVYAHFLLEE